MERDISARLCGYRRDLHRIPETGFELPETIAYVRGLLERTGCEIFSPIEGSLCAYFDAGRPDTIAFRADMDALCVEEAAERPYASLHPGKMHACGHDGHTSILLGLAAFLAQQERLANNVLLIFQPAEESSGGAKPICDTGLLERYGVKAIFALHIWPSLPKGRIALSPGAVMAKTGVISLDLYGKSVHVARAEEGADALYAGAAFLYGAYRAAEEAEPLSEKRVLRFGVMQSGTAENAISAHTHIRGTLRAYDEALHGRIAARLREIAAEAAQAAGCRCDFRLSEGYPAVCNDPALYSRAMEHLSGWDILPFTQPALTGEDFSFYQKRVPGLFFFLGAGEACMLHASDFDFDEAILPMGLRLFARLSSLNITK